MMYVTLRLERVTEMIPLHGAATEYMTYDMFPYTDDIMYWEVIPSHGVSSHRNNPPHDHSTRGVTTPLMY